MARYRLSAIVMGCSLSAFLGCQTADKTPQQKFADSVTTSQKSPGLWDRMTGQRTTPASASSPAAPEVVSKPLSKPGTPMKVETEVEFAETALASAVDPATTGSERDRRLDQARQQFSRILVRDPKNGRATIGLARVYTETGDKEKSAQYLKQYFELNPRDHKTAFDFAMVYGKRKDFAAAAAGSEFALSLDPENREYRKAYGFFLALSGQVDQAVAVLTHNRTMSDAEARYNVAGILEQTNQVEIAKQQLRLSIASDPLFEQSKLLLADMEQSSVVPATYQQR